MASTSAEKTNITIILWNSDFVPFETHFRRPSSSSLVESEKSFWWSAGFSSSQSRRRSVLAGVQEVRRVLVVCLPVSSSSSVISRAADSAAFDDGFRVRLGPDPGWVLVVAPFWWPMVAGGHCSGGWVLSRVWKTTTWCSKMGCENEPKNVHFCKMDDLASFLQKQTFFSHSLPHSKVHSWKMRLKMKLKMSQKWPKNVYREQPYCLLSTNKPKIRKQPSLNSLICSLINLTHAWFNLDYQISCLDHQNLNPKPK